MKVKHELHDDQLPLSHRKIYSYLNSEALDCHNLLQRLYNWEWTNKVLNLHQQKDETTSTGTTLPLTVGTIIFYNKDQLGLPALPARPYWSDQLDQHPTGTDQHRPV